MKKLFVLSLSMIAVLCCSCDQKSDGDGTDECCTGDYLASSIYFKGGTRTPLKTNYHDGIFQVDCEIVSDEEGDAYILLVLLQDPTIDPPPGIVWCDEVTAGFQGICTDRGVVFYNDTLNGRGFENEVKVDGFQIRSYHQHYRARHRVQYYENMYRDKITFDLDAPFMEYPVFVKKIKVTKNVPVREKINIHLPDGVNKCWGEMTLIRSTKAIEESMKTKIDPEMYQGAYFTRDGHKVRGKENIDTYCKFFPDSSMFSYLITSMDDLGFGYCENVGYVSISGPCAGLSPRVGFLASPAYFGENSFSTGFFKLLTNY